MKLSVHVRDFNGANRCCALGWQSVAPSSTRVVAHGAEFTNGGVRSYSVSKGRLVKLHYIKIYINTKEQEKTKEINCDLWFLILAHWYVPYFVGNFLYICLAHILKLLTMDTHQSSHA